VWSSPCISALVSRNPPAQCAISSLGNATTKRSGQIWARLCPRRDRIGGAAHPLTRAPNRASNRASNRALNRAPNRELTVRRFEPNARLTRLLGVDVLHVDDEVASFGQRHAAGVGHQTFEQEIARGVDLEDRRLDCASLRCGPCVRQRPPRNTPSIPMAQVSHSCVEHATASVGDSSARRSAARAATSSQRALRNDDLRGARRSWCHGERARFSNATSSSRSLTRATSVSRTGGGTPSSRDALQPSRSASQFSTYRKDEARISVAVAAADPTGPAAQSSTGPPDGPTDRRSLPCSLPPSPFGG